MTGWIAGILRQVSVTRVLILFVVWIVVGSAILFPLFKSRNLPIYGNVDDPPAVTQRAYRPDALSGVDAPNPEQPGQIRIAWISASDVIYGYLAGPEAATHKPGYIQAPIARALSTFTGKNVVVDAYALPNSRVVEKFLVADTVLRTRPDMIVVSLDVWDLSNATVSMPEYSNFRQGLLAANPSILFDGGPVSRFLHLDDISWSLATALAPVLIYRDEFQNTLATWVARLNPLNYKGAPAAAPVSQQSVVFYTKIDADISNPKTRVVPNERILDRMLDMIEQAHIPAYIYFSQTQALGNPAARGLEGALTRFKQRLPAGSRMIIDAEPLSKVIAGLDFRDTNHLKSLQQNVADHLTERLEQVYSGGTP